MILTISYIRKTKETMSNYRNCVMESVFWGGYYADLLAFTPRGI